MKDAKAFLDSFEQIQFYLRMPDFSTGHADGALVMDVGNREASCVWEGQLRLAVQGGTLRFLFENKGTLFHGRGFEMIDMLILHCRPDSVTNAFHSLLSIFNNVQGDSESLLEYRSRFDGLTLELQRCKVVIPPILLVMLFLRMLHSRYVAIVDHFWSRSKDIETSTIDAIISDASFHDGFIEVNHKKSKPTYSPGPCVPATASATTNSDCQGKVWQTPFEWLS
jgi:hypothetical protein